MRWEWEDEKIMMMNQWGKCNDDDDDDDEV